MFQTPGVLERQLQLFSLVMDLITTAAHVSPNILGLSFMALGRCDCCRDDPTIVRSCTASEQHLLDRLERALP